MFKEYTEEYEATQNNDAKSEPGENEKDKKQIAKRAAELEKKLRKPGEAPRME